MAKKARNVCNALKGRRSKGMCVLPKNSKLTPHCKASGGKINKAGKCIISERKLAALTE